MMALQCFGFCNLFKVAIKLQLSAYMHQCSMGRSSRRRVY